MCMLWKFQQQYPTWSNMQTGLCKVLIAMFSSYIIFSGVVVTVSSPLTYLLQQLANRPVFVSAPAGSGLTGLKQST